VKLCPMKKDEMNVKEEKRASPPSHSSQEPERLLKPRGDYHWLLSFQKAEVVYDITFRFAHKFLSRGDRTVDQMIQSARSGKKNLLEVSKAAPTSKKPRSNSPTSPAPASRSCSMTTKTICGPATCRSGARTRVRHSMSAGWVGRSRKVTSATGNSWRRVQRKSWPASPSASSTRRIISLTSSSAGWRRTSSNRADCASG
jgi:hypothetical protein